MANKKRVHKLDQTPLSMKPVGFLAEKTIQSKRGRVSIRLHLGNREFEGPNSKPIYQSVFACDFSAPGLYKPRKMRVNKADMDIERVLLACIPITVRQRKKMDVVFRAFGKSPSSSFNLKY